MECAMAVVNGAQNYQEVLGPGYSVGQVPGIADEEKGLKMEITHNETPSSISDTAGSSNDHEKQNLSNTEHEEQAKSRTNEIPDCKLHLKPPSERESCSNPRGRSRSSSVSSSNSRSRSRSRSSSRSASRSRPHRRRRSSRSSSRSRSRSFSPRYRRHPSSSYRRYHRSPRSHHRSSGRYRSRSRSRSHVGVSSGRYRPQSRSRSRSRGRRNYGFVHRAYPASIRSWRNRSRSRSRSRSQSSLRLTEKDRRELLEIAKANAAKALGKSVDLPPSLKKDSWLTDTLHRSFEPDSGKLSKQSRNLNDAVHTEVSPQQGSKSFSTARAVVQPVLYKEGNKIVASPKKEAKKPAGQWVPIPCQQNALNSLR